MKTEKIYTYNVLLFFSFCGIFAVFILQMR